MVTTTYSKPTEVCVSSSQAISMINDPSLIVVMAIPDATEDSVDVTFWSKLDELLPPWIITDRAA